VSSVELLEETKIYALVAPTVLPLLERRRANVITRLLLAHRDGKTDTTTIVAELAVIADLESEIKQKYNTYRTLEEKQHGKRK